MKPTKKISNNTEPNIDTNNYNASLSIALNYYNETYSLSEYKNNTIDYASNIGISLARSIPEIEFRSIGGVCRLLLREQPISLKHIEYTLSKIRILQQYKKDVILEEVIVPAIKSDTDNTKPFITKLEDYIDSYILGNSSFELNRIRTDYSKYTFNKSDNKKIITFLEKVIQLYTNHYSEYSASDDIKDSYGTFSKSNIKNLYTILNTFRESLVEVSAIVKKPKKEKPVSVQVSGMEYSLKYQTLQGLHPKDVIGKKVVYMFDTETREFIMLCSLSSKFSGAGMSFINLDESKCFKKKIRKPEEFIQALSSIEQTRESYLKFFDSIKTTQQKSSARMNINKIILKVF